MKFNNKKKSNTDRLILLLLLFYYYYLYKCCFASQIKKRLCISLLYNLASVVSITITIIVMEYTYSLSAYYVSSKNVNTQTHTHTHTHARTLYHLLIIATIAATGTIVMHCGWLWVSSSLSWYSSLSFWATLLTIMSLYISLKGPSTQYEYLKI